MAEGGESSTTHAMNVSKAAGNKPRKTNNNGGKDFHCTYCNGNTYAVDYFSYIHGFPPGHKFHEKDVKPPNKNRHATANNTNKEEAKLTTTKVPDDLKFKADEINQIKAILRGDGKNQVFENAAGIPDARCYSLSTNNPNSWIIDSGATDHISFSSNLNEKRNPPYSSVNIPNGLQATISCLGSIKITPNLELKDDLATKKMIGLGKECDGLYYLVPVKEDVIFRQNKLRVAAASASVIEAEYRSMAAITCELTWLRYLLQDLKVPHAAPVHVYYDNKVALHIAANPVDIELDCHLVQEKLQSGMIATSFTLSRHQLADIFTEALWNATFHSLLSKLGIHIIHAPT
ncbi:uncharacterized protein LOC126618114 [Malus sylvestris]|uniref:uncharacterized protein LOC126618114 n=1 Tax=Malus sylvestris TaxID=3752 RepID=UPI0021ABDD04|nr:uncharacterized protein LOC126618114 [Malus sylvestris]